MATIASLQRISPKDVSQMILSEVGRSSPTYAIVDVRDDDYIGGHIKGAMNIPSRSLEAMLPTLIRKCEDKTTVIFHCALSQQRGPSAALRYIREAGRSRQRAKVGGSSADTTDGASDAAKVADKLESREQKVYVLDRGFVGWQEVYGEDERLTEGYRKELWKDGYWG